MKLVKPFGHFILVILLTVLTQIGGVLWLLGIGLKSQLGWKKRYSFVLLYFAFNLLLVPPIASFFGRERLPVFSQEIRPINWFYPLAFRNYVTPKLKASLIETSKRHEQQIVYLDANFPFFEGFPLLPHLSHNDGKKVDIAFQYRNVDGTKTDKKPSLFGYGIYTNEDNPTSKSCIGSGFWQYDVTKYIGIPTNRNIELDTKATRNLIRDILSTHVKEKVFIEPYLKRQLQLQNYNQIRFHGCQAVRHDDHIHLEIK